MLGWGDDHLLAEEQRLSQEFDVFTERGQDGRFSNGEWLSSARAVTGSAAVTGAVHDRPALQAWLNTAHCVECGWEGSTATCGGCRASICSWHWRQGSTSYDDGRALGGVNVWCGNYRHCKCRQERLADAVAPHSGA